MEITSASSEKRKRSDDDEVEVLPVKPFISDFGKVVTFIEASNGSEIIVHADAVARNSPALRKRLQAYPSGKITVTAGDFEMLKRYVHFVYSRTIAAPDLWDSQVISLLRAYAFSWGLRDVCYTNAIMDKLVGLSIEEPRTLLQILEHLGSFLKSPDAAKEAPIWRWLVDAMGTTLSADSLAQMPAERWPASFLVPLLAKVLARMEKPEDHKKPTLADRKRYHVDEKHFERAGVSFNI